MAWIVELSGLNHLLSLYFNKGNPLLCTLACFQLGCMALLYIKGWNPDFVVGYWVAMIFEISTLLFAIHGHGGLVIIQRVFSVLALLYYAGTVIRSFVVRRSYLKMEQALLERWSRYPVEPLPRTPNKVKMLSLNMFLRPPGIHDHESDHKDSRLLEMVDMLARSDVDVVCLQEVFGTLNGRRKALVEILKKYTAFQYVYVPPFHALQMKIWPFNLHAIDSGLVIVSRFPMAEQSMQEFSTAHPFFAEFLVQKGITHVVLKVPKDILDCSTPCLSTDIIEMPDDDDDNCEDDDDPSLVFDRNTTMQSLYIEGEAPELTARRLESRLTAKRYRLVHVFNTHTQAGFETDYGVPAVRRLQNFEAFDFLKRSILKSWTEEVLVHRLGKFLRNIKRKKAAAEAAKSKVTTTTPDDECCKASPPRTLHNKGTKVYPSGTVTTTTSIAQPQLSPPPLANPAAHAEAVKLKTLSKHALCAALFSPDHAPVAAGPTHGLPLVADPTPRKTLGEEEDPAALLNGHFSRSVVDDSGSLLMAPLADQVRLNKSRSTADVLVSNSKQVSTVTPTTTPPQAVVTAPALLKANFVPFATRPLPLTTPSRTDLFLTPTLLANAALNPGAVTIPRGASSSAVVLPGKASQAATLLPPRVRDNSGEEEFDIDDALMRQNEARPTSSCSASACAGPNPSSSEPSPLPTTTEEAAIKLNHAALNVDFNDLPAKYNISPCAAGQARAEAAGRHPNCSHSMADRTVCKRVGLGPGPLTVLMGDFNTCTREGVEFGSLCQVLSGCVPEPHCLESSAGGLATSECLSLEDPLSDAASACGSDRDSVASPGLGPSQPPFQPAGFSLGMSPAHLAPLLGREDGDSEIVRLVSCEEEEHIPSIDTSAVKSRLVQDQKRRVEMLRVHHKEKSFSESPSASLTNNTDSDSLQQKAAPNNTSASTKAPNSSSDSAASSLTTSLLADATTIPGLNPAPLPRSPSGKKTPARGQLVNPTETDGKQKVHNRNTALQTAMSLQPPAPHLRRLEVTTLLSPRAGGVGVSDKRQIDREEFLKTHKWTLNYRQDRMVRAVWTWCLSVAAKVSLFGSDFVAMVRRKERQQRLEEVLAKEKFHWLDSLEIFDRHHEPTYIGDLKQEPLAQGWLEEGSQVQRLDYVFCLRQYFTTTRRLVSNIINQVRAEIAPHAHAALRNVVAVHKRSLSYLSAANSPAGGYSAAHHTRVISHGAAASANLAPPPSAFTFPTAPPPIATDSCVVSDVETPETAMLANVNSRLRTSTAPNSARVSAAAFVEGRPNLLVDLPRIDVTPVNGGSNPPTAQKPVPGMYSPSSPTTHGLAVMPDHITTEDIVDYLMASIEAEGEWVVTSSHVAKFVMPVDQSGSYVRPYNRLSDHYGVVVELEHVPVVDKRGLLKTPKGEQPRGATPADLLSNVVAAIGSQ